MKIETVTIHHPELHTESQVPEDTAGSWVGQGWVEGPFPTGDDRPPKAGKGSGFPAWLDYATKRDIMLPVDATRDDIIAAVEQVDIAQQAGEQEIDVVEPDGTEATPPVGEDPHDPEEGQQ